jgi:hypothetical protein
MSRSKKPGARRRIGIDAMCPHRQIASTQDQASSKPTVSSDEPRSVPEIVSISQTKKPAKRNCLVRTDSVQAGIALRSCAGSKEG